MTENEREKEVQIILAYQEVYGTKKGKAVLVDMLNEMKFLSSHINSAEAMVLQNFARKILWKAGIWRENNLFLIIDKLFEVPPDFPPEAEEKK